MISVHPELEEKELRLLHGLQIAPRIPWAETARILGTTAAREAARWAKLRESGLAWITAHPGGSYRRFTLALVEVDCLPGARRAVVDAACADPRAVTVEESTRGRDLLLTVITEDLRLPGPIMTHQHHPATTLPRVVVVESRYAALGADLLLLGVGER